MPNLSKVLVATDSFKGSLSAPQATSLIAKAFRPTVDVIECPLSDGGEGFVETLTAARQGSLHKAPTTNALGAPIEATYGTWNETVVVELSSAAGLSAIPPEKRNPLETTTYGVGHLIQAAYHRHPFKKLILSLGGSATVDGGVGMLEALGIRFLDNRGTSIPRGAKGLLHLASIDYSEASKVFEAEIQLAVDVDNPLLGPRGAAAVYGPQKGATPEMIPLLERGLKRLAEILKQETGISTDEMPGMGAAGGAPVGWVAIANAKLTSGFEIVASLVELDAKLKTSNLVITGEGQLDRSSFEGKVVGQVAKRCHEHRIPLVVLAGSVTAEGLAHLAEYGGVAISTTPGPLSIEEAIKQAPENLFHTAKSIVGLIENIVG